MLQGILEPVSNRADWFIDLELIDDDTGVFIPDLSDTVFKLQVRSAPARGSNNRSVYWDSVSSGIGTTYLAAVSGDAHTTVANGVVEFHFTATEMSGLTQGSYEIGITATRDGIVSQELIAMLPIVDGIVR